MVLPAKRQPLPYFPAEFHFPFIFQLRLDTSPLPSVPGSSVFRFLFLASQASETDSFEGCCFPLFSNYDYQTLYKCRRSSVLDD